MHDFDKEREKLEAEFDRNEERLEELLVLNKEACDEERKLDRRQDWICQRLTDIGAKKVKCFSTGHSVVFFSSGRSPQVLASVMDETTS